MAKDIRKINDDSKTIYGLSAAARFLDCAENTVINHANAGRLICARDTAGRRLFTLSGLRKFKASGSIMRRPAPREDWPRVQ